MEGVAALLLRARHALHGSHVLDHQALSRLLNLLTTNQNKSIKKEACWTISNITAGSKEQIQVVMNANIIGPLVHLLQAVEFDMRKEAAWAISNATSGGTHDQKKKCVNSCWKEASIVRAHLIYDGFLEGYNRWIFHGEASSCFAQQNVYAEVQVEDNFEEGDQMFDMLRDVAHGLDGMGDLGENKDSLEEDQYEGAEDFYHLVDDANQELYPGCKNFSKLRFVVKLLHTKFLGGWSDRSFDMLLQLLKEAFPKGSTLPKNFNEAKKMVRCFGLGYVSIHACRNNCVLFWKQYENADFCPKC